MNISKAVVVRSEKTGDGYQGQMMLTVQTDLKAHSIWHDLSPEVRQTFYALLEASLEYLKVACEVELCGGATDETEEGPSPIG